MMTMLIASDNTVEAAFFKNICYILKHLATKCRNFIIKYYFVRLCYLDKELFSIILFDQDNYMNAQI